MESHIWHPNILLSINRTKFYGLSLNLKLVTFRLELDSSKWFVSSRSESQSSRFQDHRSYSRLGRMHMYVGAAEKTCQRTRERATERERESAEVEDAGERRTKSICRPFSATSLSTSRLRTGIAWWTWRHRSDIPSSFTCHSSVFSHYHERIPGMFISVSRNNAPLKQLGHVNRSANECFRFYSTLEELNEAAVR